MMGKCAMGVELPMHGPCPKCGAESDNTCGRWASAANEFIDDIAMLPLGVKVTQTTVDYLIEQARKINGKHAKDKTDA